jgi:hypothetical protein
MQWPGLVLQVGLDELAVSRYSLRRAGVDVHACDLVA